MATNGNAIATVGDIRTNLGVTLTPNDNYCPTYSSITANTRLGVSGATYSSNQLVMYKHIYKKTTERMLTLTVTDWKEFIESVGENRTSDGVWMFSVVDSYNDILDGYINPTYPMSGLYYYYAEPTETDCQISGTAKQWQNLYNYIENNDSWDILGLKNYESGRFIQPIPNYNGLRRMVYHLSAGNGAANVSFMTDSTGSTTGSTATTRNCTIPIYWKENNKEGAIDCWAQITIQSNNGVRYERTYQINNEYQGTNYVHLGDINIDYTGKTFNSNVLVNINFVNGRDTTYQGTIISLKEYSDNVLSPLSYDYTWEADVFDDTNAFVNQWFALSEFARTADDYRLVLLFN